MLKRGKSNGTDERYVRSAQSYIQPRKQILTPPLLFSSRRGNWCASWVIWCSSDSPRSPKVLPRASPLELVEVRAAPPHWVQDVPLDVAQDVVPVEVQDVARDEPLGLDVVRAATPHWAQDVPRDEVPGVARVEVPGVALEEDLKSIRHPLN